MTKTFGELAVGDRFVFNGQEYIKVNEVRVSCCRSINAASASDSNNKTYIQPSSLVTINA